jgi:NAD+ kinase
MKFNRIGLICKPEASAISKTIKKLGAYLNGLGATIYVDTETSKYIQTPKGHVCQHDQIAQHCDLMISIGGDGPLLTAARAIADTDVPLVGINLGRLGFLVDISPDEMDEKLQEILNGKFHSEERIILEAKLIRDGNVVHQLSAFNEVVLHRSQTSGMIEIDTAVNGIHLNSQRSDGLIVSTPTGSTAYALSGGGPLMHPSLDALVLVPISPHTLTNRPIVLNGKSTIDIQFGQRSHHHAQVSCDNVLMPPLIKGDTVNIKRHKKRVQLLHPTEHDFFGILRAKLDWSRTTP